MVKPIPYKGKFDAASNADVRTAINDAAKHASAEFERAYLCVFSTAKDEAAAKKAAKAAAITTATPVATGAPVDDTPATGAPVDDTPATPAQNEGHADTVAALAEDDRMAIENTVLDIGQTVNAVCDVIRAGSLTLAELAQMQLAIAEYEASAAYQEAIARAMAPSAEDIVHGAEQDAKQAALNASRTEFYSDTTSTEATV
jgi:hypothetical protein